VGGVGRGELAAELAAAMRAARAGAQVVAAHYARGPIAVETKADRSPVTAADRAASAAIAAALHQAFPADAVLCEEDEAGAAPARRRGAGRLWIVDPLDGTRDFIARTDQFAVHVGLAIDGEAVVGAVCLPVSGELYVAARGQGAFRYRRGEPPARLRVSAVSAVADVRVGISGLAPAGALRALLADTGLAARAVPLGASTKHMALAAGALDACINLSPGEADWDTCAPEVVIREAGGELTAGDGQRFRYGVDAGAHPRGSIATNGACHAALVALVRARLELAPSEATRDD
jgi:3'(2'), 5'-bisphosphate nucleotidase